MTDLRQAAEQVSTRLREVIAYSKENGHDWLYIIEAEIAAEALTAALAGSSVCKSVAKRLAAQKAEPVALRPEDVTVEFIDQRVGSFAAFNTHGVRLTHKPTGLQASCKEHRSQHRNRAEAWEELTDRVNNRAAMCRAIDARHEGSHVMIDHRQVMQQALEALQDITNYDKLAFARLALRQALAAPQAGPVYQLQLSSGAWIDQREHQYDYNKGHGHTVRIVYTHPAPAPLAEPVGVAEIDYKALVEAAWARHKYAAGTNGCVAFKRGAEWFRDACSDTRPAPAADVAKAGAALSNIAYNLSQNEGGTLTAQHCRSMREAYAAWDAAMKGADQ